MRVHMRRGYVIRADVTRIFKLGASPCAKFCHGGVLSLGRPCIQRRPTSSPSEQPYTRPWARLPVYTVSSSRSHSRRLVNGTVSFSAPKITMTHRHLIPSHLDHLDRSSVASQVHRKTLCLHLHGYIIIFPDLLTTSSDISPSVFVMHRKSVGVRLALCVTCSSAKECVLCWSITLGGVQYKFGSTSHGVTMIFCARSRILPTTTTSLIHSLITLTKLPFQEVSPYRLRSLVVWPLFLHA